MCMIANEVEFGERLIEFAARAKRKKKWAMAARRWESALKFRLLVYEDKLRSAGLALERTRRIVRDAKATSAAAKTESTQRPH